MEETEGSRLRLYVDRFYPRSRGGIEQLAEDAGLRRATLYAWFSGKASPDLASLTLLARTLGVTRAEIVAVMDGQDLDALRRQQIAEEVEAAVRPLRDLMRDAGLLRGGTTPDGAARGAR
jgi:transcriptional regulator with XRE-family HTH domain